MPAPPKSAWTPVKYSQTQLGGGTTQQGVAYPGGLDLTTPSLRLQAGALRDVLNFEVAQFGGYSRVEGYERFDGKISPSEATFVIVQVAPVIQPGGGDPFVVDESLVDGPDLLDGSGMGAGFVLDLSTLNSSDILDGTGITGGTSSLVLPPIGAVVTQAVSGAIGTVIASARIPGLMAGGFYLVLTAVSGVFDSTNTLTIPR